MNKKYYYIQKDWFNSAPMSNSIQQKEGFENW